MVFSFNYPLILLLIPAAIAFVLFLSRNRLGMPSWRRKTIIVLRITVFTLLILCIAGFGLKKVSNDITTVFVVDGSDSTSRSRSTIEEFIREAYKNKKPSEKAGVVNFGADSSVELIPTSKSVFASLQSKINSNFTNIEQGLKLAASLIPAGDRKRVVLVTDGLENVGDAVKQARLLKQQNVMLDIYPVKNTEGDEVQVKQVTVPETLHLNERFEIVVRIDSTVKTGAVLKLYTDRELTAERKVEIQAGENRFAFSDIAGKGGVVTYSAVIEPDADTIVKNNRMASFSYVEDIPSVLVVQDVDEGASELLRMLGDDVRIKVSRPENLPVSVEELQKYDGFIISNVSAERFDDRFLNNLEIVIRNQGKGLLVTGGENSYAPGGYYKTPLEKVLPVNMDIKPKEEIPNLGLVLVIDKSGSMSEGQYGVSKVELAKEAAIRSTEVLKKDDMIGVIAFDAAVQWVVKTQKLDNLKGIQDAIGTIRADGGTQILPPLQEAYLALKDANTKLKHVILLTDGQAEKSGYESIIEDMRKAGITLSTVAVGRQADIGLLYALSVGGNGRFYMTDEFTDIPKIFAKETFLAGKTYLNNRRFTPNLTSYSEILNEIKSIPPLDGYVGTTAKSTARVIFTSDRDEPVLAAWQYGLGRTVAWTPDAKGMWTSSWLQWEQSPRFWKNIMSWLVQKKVREDYSIKGSLASGTGTVELTLPPDDRVEGEKVEAVIIGPTGSEQSIALEPVSPGAYKGTFDSDETGVYLANISVKKGEEIVKSITSGISIPYSPEYDIPKKDAAVLLEKLAYEGGGRILKNAGEVFAGDLEPVVSITDMTPILLALVIILLLMDIAVRRLNISLEKAGKAMHKAAAACSAATGALLKPVADKLGLDKGLHGRRVKGAGVPSAGDSGENSGQKGMEKQDALAAKPASARTQQAGDPGAHISALLDKKRKRER